MKKFFTIVASAILAGASTFAINWGDGAGQIVNLAKGAAVTLSSNFGAESHITDDNNGTDWQASPATHAYTQDWVLIDLGETKTFTDMEIAWEASHCKSYSIYVTNEEPAITKYDAVEGEGAHPAYNAVDVASLSAAATGGNDSEANYTENITFDAPQTGKYILVYANEYNNFGSQYGMRIFDVRVANIEGRDEVAALQLALNGNVVANGEVVELTVAPVNALGEELEAELTGISVSCNSEAVKVSEWADGKYHVSANKAGKYTIKATAKAGDNTVEGSVELNVAYNWAAGNIVTAAMPIQGRIKADTDDTNPMANAIDANEETFYQYNGEWGGGDSWLIVDLGKEYMIDAIGASYGDPSGNGYCVFGYATDITKTEANINEKGADKVFQNELAGENEWTNTENLNRANNTVVTKVFDASVKARYILVRDDDNPGGKPCVKEIYVSGVEYAAPYAAEIEVTASDNYVVAGTEVTLSAKVLDQYGAEFAGEVSFSYDNTEASQLNGNVFTASEIGDYTITAACGELTQDFVVSVITTSDYVFGGDKESLACEAMVTNGEVKNKSYIFDKHGRETAVEFNNTFPANLEIEFPKAQNFTMLDFYWEAACPTNYDLTVTYEDGTSATVNVVSSRTTEQKDRNDKVVDNTPATRTAEGEGIAKISLENVKKLTLTLRAAYNDAWACKLFGIDAYGVEAPAAPLDITITKKADYGTMILPFDATKKAGMEVYSIKEVQGTAANDYKYLVLEEAVKEGETLKANTPYIVKFFGDSFTYTGFATNEKDEYTDANDLLHGVMVETNAKEGDYVLQNQEGAQGFYMVATNDIKVPAYHAYLKFAGENNVKALVFDLNDVDAIGNIATSEVLVNVYDLNGVVVRKNVKACEALQGLQKGIYVVNGAKKAVK